MSDRFAASLTDRVYVEQVRSLYLNVVPSLVMWVAFIVNFGLAYRNKAEPGLLLLGVAGIVASSTRIAITMRFRDRALTAALDRKGARRLEVLFSVPYLVD